MILNRQNLYIAFICLISMVLLFLNLPLYVGELSNWVLIYTLIGAILLLNHFNIILPSGNSLSMDSAIYLACIFLFGLNVPLYVLMLSSLAFFLIRFKLEWWKHLFNFANYTIMIITTYYTFTTTGGTVGRIDIANLWPYTISLTVYFILNVIIMWLYFFLVTKQPFGKVFQSLLSKDDLKEAFISYLCTLVLSLVMTIVIHAQPIFGVFLFISLSITLSLAFQKVFSLYKNEETRAQKDFLTGLYNHGYFKQTLDEYIKKSEYEDPFSIALLDLDDFKKYNDFNGHVQGDELLTFFGSFLSEKIKDLPYIAARYGGEEFGIIMPETSQEKAKMFMDKLRKEYNDTPFKGVDILPLRCLSFSSGIAEYEKGTYGASELLARADKALYFAKAEGKNNCQIYKEGRFNHKGPQIKEEIDGLEQQLQIFLSKDIYTYQHSKRVFRYAVDISDQLSLSEDEKRRLILGALIHDIGKLEIPRDIINKKGKLQVHEWEMMKKHVTYGKEILASTKKYDDLLPLVELHHERYDGKGYPYGLKGENIPKLARILCIIDSFDAMTTERPYQKTKTFEEAIEELRKCSGQQFDPAFVDPFIKLVEQGDR